MTLYVGDEVVMRDRYAARAKCTCKHEVLLEGERLAMRFDERDFDRVPSAETSSVNMTGAE